MMGISEGLSRMRWKLSRTVLRGGATGNGGSLLGDHSGKVRIPHYITLKDGSPLAFAGIWDTWKTPEGESLETCSILTTASNSLVAVLHDRIPVILHPSEFDLWLDRSMNNPEKLQRLYQPYPAELMQEWEVSPLINKPAYDTPETISPAPSKEC